MKNLYPSLLIFMVLFLVSSVHAEPFKIRFYEIGSQQKKLLFNAVRTEVQEGERLTAQTQFTTPDGKQAVVEDLVAENGKALKYTQSQLQLGTIGSVEVKGDELHFTFTKDGTTQTAIEKRTDNFVVGPSMLAYVRASWDRLMAGETIEFRIGVLDRRETVGFKFFKTAEETVDGKEMVRMKMKPTSFIISALVDPLIFVMEKKTGRVHQVIGRMVAKRRVGDEWKDLDADAIYEY